MANIHQRAKSHLTVLQDSHFQNRDFIYKALNEM